MTAQCPPYLKLLVCCAVVAFCPGLTLQTDLSNGSATSSVFSSGTNCAQVPGGKKEQLLDRPIICFYMSRVFVNDLWYHICLLCMTFSTTSVKETHVDPPWKGARVMAQSAFSSDQRHTARKWQLTGRFLRRLELCQQSSSTDRRWGRLLL